MSLNITKLQTTIPEYVFRTADILNENGYQAYLAGGAVRDLLIGKNPKDFDIATNALPDEIQKIFPKTVNTNAHFGTILVIMTDEHGESFDIEVTTYRKEEDYIGGRWPSHVEFTSEINDDLSRRDFTINAMALNLQLVWDTTAILEEIIIDPFKGQNDLREKTIRAVGDPLARLTEDGLRGFRACRLASELEFKIELATFRAITETISIAKLISIERIRDEFLKLLRHSPKPSYGIELLRESGLLAIFLPELLLGIGITQPEWHTDDVYQHSLKTLDVSEDSIKLAGLLHDIGKSVTMSQDEKGTHFFGHDIKGAAMVSEILNRLRLPKLEVKRVATLVRWHMFYYPSADWRKSFAFPEKFAEADSLPKNGGWSDAAIRRFINNIGGEDLIDDLFKLRIADAAANQKSEFNTEELTALEARIGQVRAEDMALKITDLKINGIDLINIGIPEGPMIGKVLRELLEIILDEPRLNQFSELKPLAEKIFKTFSDN
ncbi:MAG: CCA tRNA nucleotidyltransferase [bacterium]